MALPRLSIIVFTRNSREHLLACLASYDAFHDDEHEIIVVDNASGDGTAKEISRRHPRVRCLRFDEETSFSVGNNRGLAQASGDLVLFLNPDTEFLSADIESLLSEMEAKPEIGVLGCRLRNPDGSPQASCFSDPRLTRMVLDSARRWGAERVLPGGFSPPLPRPGRQPGSPDVACSVEWLLGAFLVVRREVAVSLGGFDEDFWFHGTDLELCWRARRAGLTVRYDPRYEIMHHGHPRWSRQRREAVRRAVQLFFDKHRGKLRATALAMAYRLVPASSAACGTITT